MAAAGEYPDYLTALPLETVIEILCFIDIRTITTILPRLNKQWMTTVKDEYLWQMLCQKECGVTIKTAAVTWRDTFNKSACKHFHSLDYTFLRNKFKTYWIDYDIKCKECIGTQYEKDKELCICLHEECDYMGCTRYKGKHALQHAKTHEHFFNFKYDSCDMWCYPCMRYVGNRGDREKRDRNVLLLIIANRNEPKHLKKLTDEGLF